MNRRKRAKKNKLGPRLLLVGATLLAFAASLGVYLMVIYPGKAGPGSGRDIVLEVPWGGGARAAARNAVEAGVVRGELRFTAYLRLSGAAARLQAGRHQVRDDWSPARIADTLSRPGIGRQSRVTIREGWTRWDIADELERKGVTTARSFLAASADDELLERLEIEGETAEGYLFPETYLMEPDTEAVEIVERLVAMFRSRVGPLFDSRPDHLAELHRTAVALARELNGADREIEDGDIEAPSGAHVAVMLASMVEAETARPEERPLVAAVMLNRLRSPDFTWRKLQIDPTVRYGCIAEPERAPSCSEGADPLRTRHLADGENRYNTYAHPGFPPGPIGNPSASSLEAALAPASVDYLYFVARGDGGHVFSSTLAEHNEAVARYRRLMASPDAGSAAP